MQNSSRGFAIFPSLRLTVRVWFEFIEKFRKREPAAAEPLLIGSREVPLSLVRHPRARRYRLRLDADGKARVTIPRGGSVAEARQFVERSRDWLEQQLRQLATRPRRPAAWLPGAEILFRGELVKINSNSENTIQVGVENISVTDPASDLRPAIEHHLRKFAQRELPPRTLELARQHGLTVGRVTVRNQHSRWGSCSRRGTISLNWRLIQTPDFVRDYIILHELAHLRQMNHSEKFWREVEIMCPAFRDAKRWLKQHQEVLR